MKTQSTKYAALIAALCTATSLAVRADDSGSSENSGSYNMMITTAQGAGAFNSTLSGTQVETFDNLPTGVSKNVVWNGVGTFDQLNVIPANIYGGAPDANFAKGSPYAVEGLNSIKTTTLTLNAPSSYFGLYWSAGDAANDLKFYNGKTLVADFTTANLINMLPNAYKGNPNPAFKGADYGEKFGFINFLGGTGTSWDKIVFSNTTSSGFEADNYTTRLTGWNPAIDGLPGTPVVDVTTKNGVESIAKINNVSFDGSTVKVTTISGSNKTAVSTQSDFFKVASTDKGESENNGKIASAAKAWSVSGIASPEPSSILTFAFLGSLVLFIRKRFSSNREVVTC